MIATLDIETVRTFLKTCRKEIQKGNCHLVNRVLRINGKKITSKQALLDLGILKKQQVWDYISELTENDYVKIDFDYDKTRDQNSEIFVFKKKIAKKDVYIKLTLKPSGVVCISFHESYDKRGSV